MTLPTPIVTPGVGEEECYYRPYVGAQIKADDPGMCLPVWWKKGGEVQWSGVGHEHGSDCCAPAGVLDVDPTTGQDRLFAQFCCGEDLLHAGRMEIDVSTGLDFWLTTEKPGPQIEVPSCLSFSTEFCGADRCACHQTVPTACDDGRGVQRVPQEVAFWKIPPLLYLHFNEEPYLRFELVDPLGAGGFRLRFVHRLLLTHQFTRWHPQHLHDICDVQATYQTTITHQVTAPFYSWQIALTNFRDENDPPPPTVFVPGSNVFTFSGTMPPDATTADYPTGAINWAPCLQLIDPPPTVEGGFRWEVYDTLNIAPADTTSPYPRMPDFLSEPFYKVTEWDGTIP